MATSFAGSLSRRAFLRRTGAAALLAVLPRPGVWAEAAGAARRISVFHTTDLHGHILPTTAYDGTPDLGGLARCAAQIRKWKAEQPDSLTLDIGDLYQGTQLGLQDRGLLMVKCLNHLQYDAWIVGNHEFDWGIEPFREALRASAMPVLACNAKTDGKLVGEEKPAAEDPFCRLAPSIVREFNGLKVAVIGVTTPGMPYWFPPELLGGFEALDPVAIVERRLKELRAEHRPHAVIIAGHMGLPPRGDDFANRVNALCQAFPEIAAFLGGHTHRDLRSVPVGRTLFSQANYHGINAGRLDLDFDAGTGRLVAARADTSTMDHAVAGDPAILDLARDSLADADKILQTPVGTLGEPFSVRTRLGGPSDVERLIASAILEGMRKRGVPVDVVVHGLFWPKGDWAAGPKTIADVWEIIPFENQVVTAEFDAAGIRAMAAAIVAGTQARNSMGLTLKASGRGKDRRLDDVSLGDGTPLPPGRKLVVAMNSFDASSGGRHFLAFRDLTARSSANRQLHPVQTRQMLIDFIASRGTVTHQDLLV